MFLPEGGFAAKKFLELTNKGAGTKAGKYIGLRAVNNFFTKASKSKIGNTIIDLERQAQWHGGVEEFLEEIADGSMNAWLVGDQVIRGKDGKIFGTTDKDALFNQDNLIDTVLGVGVMSLAFPFAKTLGYGYENGVAPKIESFRFERKVKRMMRNADDACLNAFGGDETAWGQVRNKLSMGSEDDVKRALLEVLGSDDYSNAQKIAARDYAVASQGHRLIESMLDELRSDTRIDTLMQAYEDGYDADEQQRSDIAIEAADGKEGAEEAWNGVQQRIEDDADMMAAEQREEAKVRTNKNDGAIHTATLKELDADGNPREVFVVDGDFSMDAEGNISGSDVIVVYDPVEGKNREISPMEISSLGEVTTAAQQEENIETNKQAYIQQQMDAATGRFNPHPGQLIDMPDGGQAVVLATDEENVTLQMPDGTQQTMAIADIQKIADGVAMEEYRQRHPEAQQVESAEQPVTEQPKGAPEAFEPMMELTIRDEEGNEQQVVVTGGRARFTGKGYEDDPNGKFVELYVPGSEEPMYIHENELQKRTVDYKEAEQPKEEVTEGTVTGTQSVGEAAPVEPVGRNILGSVFDQFKGRAKEAIDFLLRRKEGDAVAALHHKDVGDIDLWYGNDTAGLKKIAEKHPEVLGDLQGIIDGMHVVSASENRVVLESDTHKAVVSKMLGNEKTDNWLLTAYEKKGTSASSSDIETEPEGERNGTAAPQNPLSDGKGTNNISSVQAMPMRTVTVGKGKDKQDVEEPDFMATTAQRGHQYIYNEKGYPREVADEMVQTRHGNAAKTLDELTKSEPKMSDSNIGGSMALYDKIHGEWQAKKQAAEQEVKYWEDVMAEQQKAIAAEQAALKAQRQEQKEAEQGVPDMSVDKAADARRRGYRVSMGNRFDRQEPVQGMTGNETEIKFSDNDKVKGFFKVVESQQVQPSHMRGQRNPLHFITEAQPKDRTDEVSDDKSSKMAKNINPKEITEGVTAYVGAPVINSRGEVIQGNNRAISLKKLSGYPESAAKYKQYLIDHAAEFGLNADEIAKMENPVLVREVDVTDDEAIRLGQFTANDTESGGKQRMSASNILGQLDEQKTKSLFNLLLETGESEEDMTLDQIIDRNGTKVMTWLNRNGVINATQTQSAYNNKGQMTPEAKNDLKDLITHHIFKGGSDAIGEAWGKLPVAAQKALAVAMAGDLQLKPEDRLLPDVQNAIMVAGRIENTMPEEVKSARRTSEAKKRLEEMEEVVKAATQQMDLTTNKPIISGYSDLEMKIAAEILSLNQSQIKAIFEEYQRYVLGTGGSLFGEATKMSRQEAVEKVFNVKDTRNGSETETGIAESGDGARAEQLGRGERPSQGAAASGEPGTAAAAEQPAGEVAEQQKVDYRQQAEKAIADILDGVERGGSGPVVSNEMTEAIQRIADMEADAEEALDSGVEDADRRAQLEAQRDAASKWLDENVRGQRVGNEEPVKTTKRDKAILGALVDKLRKFLGKGRVVTKLTDDEIGLINWENGNVRLNAAQKRTLETARLNSQGEGSKGTVVSSVDGAKILKNLDTLAENLENKSNQSKTFIGDVAKAIGAEQFGSKSQYATFETKNGLTVTIRLGNHNATVSNFDNNGENNGISIVISRNANKGITNDGAAHLVEFFYPDKAISKAEGKPLAEIVRSIKQSLYSGEYKDNTGIAEREEVNARQIRFHRVFHGSGADFDRFDSSHMGDGEGAQAYGWGHYTTEVEGIGRMYARAGAGLDAIKYKGMKGGEVYDRSDERPEYDAASSVINSILSGKTVDIAIKDAIAFHSQMGENEMVKEIRKLSPSDFNISNFGILYTVDIPDDNGNNYLEWDKKVSKEAREKIQKALEDAGQKHIIGKDADGQRVYKELSGLLGSDKAASEFLHDAGFTGIKYPAQFRSGGREDGAKNYVIFDDGDLKITDKVKFFRTADGEAFGFTVGGKLYIDMDIAKADTAVHEYTHLWVPMVKEADPKMWQEIKDVLTKDKDVQPFMEIVKQRYPELTKEGREDDFMEEVLAHFSGAKGLERLEEAAREYEEQDGQGLVSKAKAMVVLNKVKAALEKFWGKVAELFGIKFRNAQEIADKVLSDLLHGVDPTKVRTERIKNEWLKPEEEKTLMGVHNISEEKLRKALKQGGFANPSMAVIDTRNGGFDSYGEISLIPRSSLIDARTGRNAGTWAGDAWTPTYPSVSTHITDKGHKHIEKIAKDASDGNSGMRSHIWSRLESFIEDKSDRLHYLFLKQTGREPEILGEKTEHSHEEYEELEKIFGKGFKWTDSQLTDEQHDALLQVMMGDIEQMAEDNTSNINDPEQREKARQYLINSHRKSLLDENGKMWFANWNNYVYEVLKDEERRQNPRINYYGTDLAAQKRVNNEGLTDEYEQWKANLLDEGDSEEKLFAGFTPSGNRRYLPNTVENASKLMNKHGDANAYDSHGLNATKATLLKRMRSLADIRKHRESLKGEEEYNESQKRMSDELFDIISQISDLQKISDNQFSNVDYAESRLQEAITKRDPIDHLNKEYGYHIAKDSDLASQIINFIEEAKRMPAKYFETKFKRPVALDEFAVAVVPEGTSQDVVDALKNAGLDVRTYDGTSENRQAVTLEAVRGRDDIRFQKAGEEQTKTPAFKNFFGDWEKAARIEKLRKSPIVTVEKEDYNGKYNLDANSAQRWLKQNLKGDYPIDDTGEMVQLVNIGAEKVTSHNRFDDVHLKSISAIPKMLKNAIFIDEMPNTKNNDKFDKYRYYVVGVNIDGVDYTAKIVIGVKNGKKYYDHSLTQLEKTKLIDMLSQPVQGFKTTGNASLPSYTVGKDTKLFDILRNNSSKVVDDEGKPLVVYHGAYDGGFSIFDKSKRGTATNAKSAKKGFFFTDSKKWGEEWARRSANGELYEVYLNMRNPLVVDFEGKSVNADAELNKLINQAKREGYDGVIAKNLKDGFEVHNQYIVFKPNQIKSADPVTYDDQGNVIPLSQRFNSRNADIRWQRGHTVDGLNSGYTTRDNGTAISNRAAYAESEGKYTEGKFRSQYKVGTKDFALLKALGLVKSNEWHHTGRSYTKSDFYEWEDHGTNDYNEENLTPEGSLAEKYQEKKKEIAALAKAYDNAKWEHEPLKRTGNVPSYEQYSRYFLHTHKYDLLSEQEEKAWGNEHEAISAQWETVPSYERKMLHEAVDNRYMQLAASRINEEAVRAKYNEEYGERIKENERIEDENKEIKKRNAESRGKEYILTQICEAMGISKEVAESKAQRASERIRAEEMVRQSEAARAEAEKKADAIRVESEKKQQAYVERMIKEGRANRLVRVSKRPENFVTKGEEMYGRYGWFDASSRYNLPVYYSGIAFDDKRAYNHYNKIADDAREKINEVYREMDNAITAKNNSQYAGNENGEQLQVGESPEEEYSYRDMARKLERGEISQDEAYRLFEQNREDIAAIEDGEMQDAVPDLYAQLKGQQAALRQWVGDKVDAGAERQQGAAIMLQQAQQAQETYVTNDGVQLNMDSLLYGTEQSDAGDVAEPVPDEQQTRGKDLTDLRLRKLEPGETCHVERRYEESRQFSFTGKDKIESMDDVAYIFKQLETAAVENTFLVLVKDGKPTVIHLGMGGYTGAGADLRSAVVAYNEMKPDEVYFVHNHPSGTLKASLEDRKTLDVFTEVFGGRGVVKDGIIIDTTSGKYGVFGVGNVQEKAMPSESGDDVPMKVYTFSKQVFSPDWNPQEAFKITDSGKVAEFVSSHRLGEHKKMSLIVVNNSGSVVGNFFLPWTKLSDIKELFSKSKVTIIESNSQLSQKHFSSL